MRWSTPSRNLLARPARRRRHYRSQPADTTIVRDFCEGEQNLRYML